MTRDVAAHLLSLLTPRQRQLMDGLLAQDQGESEEGEEGMEVTNCYTGGSKEEIPTYA